MAVARESTRTWLDAAFSRFQSGGLAEIRVEAIARDIGATKGSFYWHFSNREALVLAVMSRWEQEQTNRVIDGADQADSPQERLGRLYGIVHEMFERRNGEATLYVQAEAEGVREIVARVTQRRIDYVAQILEQLGFDRSEAQNRSTIALAAVLGLQQLMAGTNATELRENMAELTEAALRMTLGR